ncbi:MAG: hypothetical protein F6K22_28660 [Okeania sp. SIO2F4]|nr:hypothetical protein [Okeania sp. SIO2F4]NES06437.1 hypothetical protein [Okeania sp. SIO2F4]
MAHSYLNSLTASVGETRLHKLEVIIKKTQPINALVRSTKCGGLGKHW